ncbi:MAG: HEPN domain-containing protein [Planctomycetes bacterium]|nr:HEPN domain-containing protein [Planctomycetota bacterium]
MAGELEARSPGLAGLRDDVGVLDQYYIPTRYPDALPGGIPATLYRANDSERALTAGRRTLAVARSVLAKPGPG